MKSFRRGRKRVSERPRPDFKLLFLVLGLVLFGVITVYNVSLLTAYESFGGKYHFLAYQLVWLVLGVGVGIGIYVVDYHRLRRVFSIGFFVSILALLLTSLGGLSEVPVLGVIPRLVTQLSFYEELCPLRNGARRWLMINPAPFSALPLIGRVGFQPTELLKLSLIGAFSFWFSESFSGSKGKNSTSVKKSLILFSVWFCAIGFLVLLQPDFGTLLLLSSLAFGLLFVAHAPLWYFFLTIPAGILGSVMLILLSPYRRDRLLTFLAQDSSDPLGSGYQINQVLIALGSGGIWGLGFGNSRQKHGYIPEVVTDSIFAVLGEELGWVGVVFILAAFVLLLWRGVLVARDAPDSLGRLLSAGVVIWVGVQAILNLAAVTALIPFTGIPLPLISYGGSSLIFSLAGLGLLLNVSKT